MLGTDSGQKGAWLKDGQRRREAIEFCTYYLDIKRVRVLESRHEGRLRGKGTIGEKSVTVDDPISFRQAQFAVLQQAEGVMPYIDEHRQSLQTLYPSRSRAWLDKKHKEEFVSWLRRRLLGIKLGNYGVWPPRHGLRPQGWPGPQGYGVHGAARRAPQDIV